MTLEASLSFLSFSSPFACFIFQDRISQCSPFCPGTHSIDQAGLELRDLLPIVLEYWKYRGAPGFNFFPFKGKQVSSLISERKNLGFQSGLPRSQSRLVEVVEGRDWPDCFLTQPTQDLAQSRQALSLPPPHTSLRVCRPSVLVQCHNLCILCSLLYSGTLYQASLTY